MVSSNASAAVNSLCRQHTWPLNLEPGQNQFTIEVTSPQVCAAWPLSLSRDSNRSVHLHH